MVIEAAVPMSVTFVTIAPSRVDIGDSHLSRPAACAAGATYLREESSCSSERFYPCGVDAHPFPVWKFFGLCVARTAWLAVFGV